jgi:hypothetical protein
MNRSRRRSRSQTDGKLYGVGSGGGFNHGSIFSIIESGDFSVLGGSFSLLCPC